VALTLTAYLFIIFFTYLTTPVWKATTKILIRSNPQQQLILFKDLASPAEDVTKINPASNLVQILTSQELAQEVVRTFKLDEISRIKIEEPGTTRDIIKRFIKYLVTYPITLSKEIGVLEGKQQNYFTDAVKNLVKDAQDIELEESTNVINLSIWGQSPKLASDIANYMAQHLIAKSVELDQSNAIQVYEFTKNRLHTAKAALLKSEKELLEFRKSQSIIDISEQKKAKIGEMHNFESQYINITAELKEVQAKLKEMSEEISKQKKVLEESKIFTNNPIMKELITSLNTDKIQLAGDLEIFSETSKNVKSLKARTSKNRSIIEEELKNMLQNDNAVLHSLHPDLPREYAQIAANVAALFSKRNFIRKEMESLRSEAFRLSILETELEKFNRNKETNEKLYKNLLDKLAELEVQKASQMSGYDLKVIDKAYMPDDADADWPKVLIVIPLGLIGSIVLGIATVFFIEYWVESFKTPSEIEDKLELPVLCTVPEIK
jgi:uncharacterized protein involved in exopolysaccharide biosynthesis